MKIELPDRTFYYQARCAVVCLQHGACISTGRCSTTSNASLLGSNFATHISSVLASIALKSGVTYSCQSQARVHNAGRLGHLSCHSARISGTLSSNSLLASPLHCQIAPRLFDPSLLQQLDSMLRPALRWLLLPPTPPRDYREYRR